MARNPQRLPPATEASGDRFLLTADGQAAAPALSWQLDQDTGLFRASSDVLGFSAGNAEYLRLTSAAQDIAVFNEAGADIDFRVETDGQANAFVIDAGALGGHGQMGFFTTIDPSGAMIFISHQALTTPTNANFVTVAFGNSGAVTIPTGTADIVATMNISEPNITANGTITNGVSLRIDAAPTEGTNNFAFWVDTGVSRFDGNVQVNADSATVSNLITAASGSTTVFNDLGTDIDFRIEGDTATELFLIDAGLDVMGIGRTISSGTLLLVGHSARTALANVSWSDLTVSSNGVITIPTGTAANVDSLLITEPNITATGSVTTACTVRIADAPTEGGSNFALLVDSGAARFDGNMGFFATAPVAQQTSGANLTNNVTSGGTDNVIANFTDLSTYANDAAAIRNDIYQLARKLKQVNDGLRAFGLLT